MNRDLCNSIRCWIRGRGIVQIDCNFTMPESVTKKQKKKQKKTRLSILSNQVFLVLCNC